jgi:hypothetical protein
LRLFVERCLTQPSGARLIVTSREQVKLAAAGLRGTRSIPLREGLPEDEAVALLRDLDPVFELLESAEYKPDLPEDLPELMMTDGLSPTFSRIWVSWPIRQGT